MNFPASLTPPISARNWPHSSTNISRKTLPPCSLVGSWINANAPSSAKSPFLHLRPLKTRADVRPIMFSRTVSFHRALLQDEPDTSSTRRTFSCRFCLFFPAVGCTGSIRGGVSTSWPFRCVANLARTSFRAALLPHASNFLFAKTVSALRKSHLAALRPGTCIYIIRHVPM